MPPHRGAVNGRPPLKVNQVKVRPVDHQQLEHRAVPAPARHVYRRFLVRVLVVNDDRVRLARRRRVEDELDAVRVPSADRSLQGRLAEVGVGVVLPPEEEAH